MKNRQQEVGIQLPPTDIQEDTRTYEQLCKDARNAIERSAKDWIPRFCNALKRQYPLLKFTEIKNKVIDDWSRLWKPKTISDSFPDWIKNPKNVASGTKAGAASAASTREKRRRSESTESQQQEPQQQGQSATDTNKSQQPEISEATKARQKQNTLEQNIIGDIRAVIEKITGYNETQILKFGRDYRALTSETKAYRFGLSKKFTDLNLKMIYDDSRTLYTLLDDFLKQLDDELGSRKKKESLTSE